MAQEPGKFDFQAMMEAIQSNGLYTVQEGRGPASTDGIVKALPPYEPVSREIATAGHLKSVAAAEEGGIGGLLGKLDGEGKLGIWSSRAKAIEGGAKRYQEQIAADAKAGMGRSRLILVDNAKTADQFARASEEAGRAAGAVTGESVRLRSYAGDTTFAPGQRGVASGAFKQADRERGIAGGESFTTLAIGAHPEDPKRNPGTYMTVKLDPDPTGQRIGADIRTIRVATPEDDFNKVDRSLGARVLRREDMPVALREVPQQGKSLWASSLNSAGLQNLSVDQASIIASSDLTSSDVYALMAKVKGGIDVHSTRTLGDAEGLAAKIGEADIKLEKGEIKREPTDAMEIDSGAKTDFAEMRKKIMDPVRYSIQEGRGVAAADGVIKSMDAYKPVEDRVAHAAYINVAMAAGKDGVGGVLGKLDEAGQLAVWTSRATAIKGGAQRYQEQIAADAKAGMGRSRLILVDNAKTADQFAHASEEAGRAAGTVRGDSVRLRSYAGDMTFAPGQRGIATGAFKQADRERGIAGGESFTTLAIGAHPEDPKRNPGTYMTVKLDPDPTGQRVGADIRTIRVATPEDDFNKVDRSLAARVLRREDMPVALREVPQQGKSLWASSLNSAGIKNLSVMRASVIASSDLTSSDVFTLMAKVKGGIDVHSTRTLGDAEGLAAKIAEADIKLERGEIKRETGQVKQEPANDMETNSKVKTEDRLGEPRRGLVKVSSPPKLNVVQGGREDGASVIRLGRTAEDGRQIKQEEEDAVMRDTPAQMLGKRERTPERVYDDRSVGAGLRR